MSKAGYTRGGQAAVASYVETHPLTRLYVDVMTKELSLTPRQIQSAIWTLRRDKGYDIRTVIKGGVWMYHPTETPVTADADDSPPTVSTSSEMWVKEFQCLRQSSDGELILIDRDRVLYRARVLE